MEYMNSYQELSEIINPEMLGEIVGAGFNSVAISPNNSWKIELDFDSVLIFSLEREKEIFLKKMTGVKIKKYNTRTLFKDEKMSIKIIKEYFSVFCMEKLKEIEWELFPEEKIEKVESFFKFINKKFSATYHKDDLPWVIEELSLISKKYKGIHNFCNALKKALIAIERSTIDSLFIFDLHEGQFMLNQKNKIVCIDPVLFSYKKLGKQLRR